jgi:predicted DNA-binding transcriptional regulator YafY
MKMFDPIITGEPFTPDSTITESIEQSETQWIGTQTKEAVFQIDSEAATYFRRRNRIPNQKIEKELEDGGVIVSGRFTDDKQALNIVGYWLPHIRVLSPESLNKQFHKQIQKYLHTDLLHTQ